MFTHAKLVFEYNNDTISLLVKSDDLPYFYIYGYFPIVDYVCLRWKIEQELKIKPENLYIDSKFVEIYKTLSPNNGLLSKF